MDYSRKGKARRQPVNQGAETIGRTALKKVDATDIDLRPRIGRRRA